ncbi:MAG: anti-sigma factor, partial [Rhodoglobus sp.]
MSPNNKSADDAAQLSGAYALNALSAAEREQLEAHMAGNEQTRDEVTELTDTAVVLGLAVTPEAPPASLKASIMAQVAATPQLPAETVEPAQAAGPVERRAAARWFTRPVAALAAAAASVLLIVGGGVITNTITTNNYLDAQAGQLAAINAADDSQRKVITLDGGGTATLVWSQSLAS